MLKIVYILFIISKMVAKGQFVSCFLNNKIYKYCTWKFQKLFSKLDDIVNIPGNSFNLYELHCY